MKLRYWLGQLCTAPFTLIGLLCMQTYPLQGFAVAFSGANLHYQIYLQSKK